MPQEVLSRIEKMERGPFYHGTSSNTPIVDRLLPPDTTNILSETGRKINLDRVFFTADEKSARIYAGRACDKFGGEPVVYRVYPVGEVEKLHEEPGTSVYCAQWAFASPANDQTVDLPSPNGNNNKKMRQNPIQRSKVLSGR